MKITRTASPLPAPTLVKLPSVYDKSNTPTPKNAAQPASPDGSSRPSCPAPE